MIIRICSTVDIRHTRSRFGLNRKELRPLYNKARLVTL